MEPLPDGPRRLPSLAPHVVDRYAVLYQGQAVYTTIDAALQERSAELVARHGAALAANGVFHAGAIITEIETGNVVAYIGNTPATAGVSGSCCRHGKGRKKLGKYIEAVLICRRPAGWHHPARYAFARCADPATAIMPRGISIAGFMVPCRPARR
jgi:penicillin-binding protein 1C